MRKMWPVQGGVGLSMTDADLKAIRERHKLKSFRDQDWIDMESLLAEIERLQRMITRISAAEAGMSSNEIDAALEGSDG